MIVPGVLRARIDAEHAGPIVAALGPLDGGASVAMPASALLLLCFTNRCGSNYLAALLAATGAFNEAGEFFNAETVLHHAGQLRLGSLRAYMAALPRVVGPPGGWLAAKASLDQLIMLADAGILDGFAGRVVYVLLERRDRLGQAISRCIAGQNRRWTTGHAAAVPDAALVYHRSAIEAEMARVALACYGFYGFFAANHIVPLHLAYEECVTDPAGAVAAIGDLTGQRGLLADPARVGIGRQANAVNADWRARYLAGA